MAKFPQAHAKCRGDLKSLVLTVPLICSLVACASNKIKAFMLLLTSETERQRNENSMKILFHQKLKLNLLTQRLRQ